MIGQPRRLKDQFGNIVLAPTGQPAGEGQLHAASGSVVPSSPAEAAVGGAGPDAAKMAGTPNQTSAPTALPSTPPNAIRVKAQGPTLQDAMRAEQAQAPQMTADQAKQVAKTQQYKQEFGDLGARVQNLIETALPTTPGAAAPGAASAINQDAAAKLTPDQLKAVQAVASNPSVETIAAAKQALGGADPMQYINSGDSASVAGVVAGQTADSIHLDPATLRHLGYTPDQVADALGIDPSALSGMTVAQFQQAIQDKLASESTSVEQLKSQLADPALGPNERAAARQQLAALGATGVYASEQEMDALSKSVADADTIEFNGQEMSVDELLGDDHMTSVVMNYLDDPGYAEHLRKTEPKFAAFIDSHANALKELAIQTSDATKQFDDIQSSNKAALANLDATGAGDVAKQILETLAPGSTSEYATKKLDLSQYPGIALLTDPAAMQKAGMDPAAYTSNLQAIAALSKDAATELAQMSPADLAKLGVGTRDSPAWKQYYNYVQDWTALEHVDPSNPTALAKYIFGSHATPQSMQKMWSTALAEQKLGGHSQFMAQYKNTLDTNHDGRIDDPATIKKTLEARLHKGVGVTHPAQAGAAGSMGYLRTPRGPNTKHLAGALAAEAAAGPITPQQLKGHWQSILTAPWQEISGLLRSGSLTPSSIGSLRDVLLDRVKRGEITYEQAYADAPGLIPHKK